MAEQFTTSDRIKQFLGIQDVSSKFLQVLQVNICYQIFMNLHSIFVNTLFLKLTGDNTAVMQYNTIMMVLSPVMSILCVPMMRRFSGKMTFTTAIVDSLAMYVTFFVVMSRLDQFVVLIALLAAIGQGFFSMTYLNSVAQFSSQGNAGQTVAFMGVTNGVISLGMPFLSGLLISRFEGLAGYYVVFGISTLVALVALYKALRLPQITFNSKKAQFGKMLSIAFHSVTWRSFILSETIKGFRSGVMKFFLNVLIYQIVQSEALVGTNNLLVGLAAILANWVCGRVMRDKNRVKLLYSSVTALAMATALLYFGLNVTTIMFFAVINSFLGCVMDTGYTTMFYLSVDKVPGAKPLSAEFIVFSQVCIGIGGALGTVMMAVLPNTTFMVVTGMLVLVLTQYISSFIMHVQEKDFARIDREKASAKDAQVTR